MDEKTLRLTMLGMLVVTYLPRFLPAAWLSSRRMPRQITIWLRYVPVAVLAALLFPALLAPDGQLAITTNNLFMWAAIPTCLVAWKTRSMFAAVIVGVLCVALARLLFL